MMIFWRNFALSFAAAVLIQLVFNSHTSQKFNFQSISKGNDFARKSLYQIWILNGFVRFCYSFHETKIKNILHIMNMNIKTVFAHFEHLFITQNNVPNTINPQSRSICKWVMRTYDIPKTSLYNSNKSQSSAHI